MLDQATFFVTAWNSVPSELKLIFSILIVLGIFGMLFLKGFKNVLDFLVDMGRDLYYWLKLKLIIRNEIKRIETLLNWKKNKPHSKKYYASDKVKIQNVYDKKDEKPFVEASKKGYIVVIKQKLKDDKSDNLLKATFHLIRIDFLADIRKYISSELAMALTNKEVISKLREMEDYVAESRYLKDMVIDDKIEELATDLDEIDIEGIYGNLYLPYLLNLKNYHITQPKDSQKKSIELLKFLNDDVTRLTECFDSKYFPKTSFVYVKRITTPEIAHIKRAQQKFLKEGCVVLIVSGWKNSKSSIKRVSKILENRYGFPVICEFTGERLRKKEEYIEIFSFVHAKKEFKLEMM